MLSKLLTSVSVLLVIYVLRIAVRFRTHLRQAHASGLPYVVTPAYYFSIPWLLSQRFILPSIRRLPQSWQGVWVDVITSGWGYSRGHTIFERVGRDTFISVAPGSNILYTTDADVIEQVTTRRNEFPKPIDNHLYQRMNLYGHHIVSVEGEEWRKHRKVVAPSFSDRSNALVFEESIRQAQFMVQSWQDRGSVLPKITDDALRLSLHVISRAGFGISNAWPGQEHEESESEKDMLNALKLQQGHKLTFLDAMEGVLVHLLRLMLIPPKLMALLPFATDREALLSHTEWSRYLEELFTIKQRSLSTSGPTPSRGFDLMASMIHESTLLSTHPTDGLTTGLTKPEILGNSFIFLNAGHETSAHTIQMCILHLAIYPHLQRHLQASLDSVLGTRSPSSWSYESDFPRLLDGWAGAVMHEALRLVPSVINVPKHVRSGAPQLLRVEGRDHAVAGGTNVWLAAAAVHRNPRYWPDAKGLKKGEEGWVDDLAEFRAERWMMGDGLFRPRKGSFIPFSEGQRSCIGQRFARTEIVAVLARVFKEWSVELVVEGEGEEKVGGQGIRGRFEEARRRAVRTIKEGCYTAPTLRLREGEIPIRLVKRGEERFPDM